MLYLNFIFDTVPPSFSFVILKEKEKMFFSNLQCKPSVHGISVHLPPLPYHSMLKGKPQITEESSNAVQSSLLIKEVQNSNKSLKEKNLEDFKSCNKNLDVLERCDNKSDSSDNAHEI